MNTKGGKKIGLVFRVFSQCPMQLIPSGESWCWKVVTKRTHSGLSEAAFCTLTLPTHQVISDWNGCLWTTSPCTPFSLFLLQRVLQLTPHFGLDSRPHRTKGFDKLCVWIHLFFLNHKESVGRSSQLWFVCSLCLSTQLPFYLVIIQKVDLVVTE